MELRKEKIDLYLDLSPEEVESIFRREKVEKSFRQIMTNSLYRDVEGNVLDLIKDYAYEKLDINSFNEKTLEDLKSLLSREHARICLKYQFLTKVIKQVILYDKSLEEQLVQTINTKKAIEFLSEDYLNLLRHVIDIVSEINACNATYNQISDMLNQYLKEDTLIN